MCMLWTALGACVCPSSSTRALEPRKLFVVSKGVLDSTHGIFDFKCVGFLIPNTLEIKNLKLGVWKHLNTLVIWIFINMPDLHGVQTLCLKSQISCQGLWNLGQQGAEKEENLSHASGIFPGARDMVKGWPSLVFHRLSPGRLQGDPWFSPGVSPRDLEWSSSKCRRPYRMMSQRPSTLMSQRPYLGTCCYGLWSVLQQAF